MSARRVRRMVAQQFEERRKVPIRFRTGQIKPRRIEEDVASQAHEQGSYARMSTRREVDFLDELSSATRIVSRTFGS